MSQSLNDKNFRMRVISQSTPTSTHVITRPIVEYQTNDRRQTNLEKIDDNSRQHRVRFTSKENLKKNKFLNFISQE